MSAVAEKVSKKLFVEGIKRVLSLIPFLKDGC